MQTTAQKVLADFIRTMPDVPFTADDIVIEFAPREQMAERALALCALYVPDKKLNDSQLWEFENTIGANALTGREKSAVLVRMDKRDTKKNLREVMFHEFMRVFCNKLEIDGEHFIDIYGSGHTPDENPENTLYDGHLNAGYVVWSEFIAQYYALKYVNKGKYSVTDLSNELMALLNEVHIGDRQRGKQSFAMVCSYLFLCDDVSDFIELLNEPDFLFADSNPNGASYGAQTRAAFQNCLLHLQSNMQKEKPWKINENFIAELGAKFIAFASLNSLYLGIMNPVE